MASRLRSYLLAPEDRLWDFLQKSSGPVDCLEGCDVEMFDILVDFLSANLRIGLPTLGYPITLGNCTVVSQLTWHEAKVLQTKLARHGTLSVSGVMRAYERECQSDGEWGTFLARQRDWFTSDTQRLIFVVSSDSLWPDLGKSP